MDDYFTQRIRCDTTTRQTSRYPILKALCEGKRVLHIGCADYPVFDPARNLHLYLQQFCEIDGVDDRIEEIAPYCKGSINTAIDYDKAYDVVLVPEVIEHTLNAGLFLQSLDKIKAPMVIITAPCAYQCASHFKPMGEAVMIETVHPDHKCWYSPYTLKNLIEQATDWTVDTMQLINNISVMAVCTKSPK